MRLRSWAAVAAPQPLQRPRQRFRDDLGVIVSLACGIGSTGAQGVDKLVVISLRLQRGGHSLVGENGIVHVGGGGVRAHVVLVYLEPHAQWFSRILGDQVLGVFPGAVWEL